MEFRRVLFRSTVDGVIAVVDGPAVADGLFAGDPEAVAAQRAGDDSLDHDTPLEELFEEQLACADMVVINKADLLDAARLVEVEAAVARHLRPAVKTLRTSHGAIAVAVLPGLGAAADTAHDSRTSHHDQRARPAPP